MNKSIARSLISHYFLKPIQRGTTTLDKLTANGNW